MNNLIIFLFLITISFKAVLCQRKDIHHMMYETFKNAAMCFRILNGTNQFGCSTSQSGSTGVVHFVNNAEDVQWLLKNGTAGPYMAIVPPKFFIKEVMLQLRDSPHISGVLLAINSTADRPANMSPDDTCPNRYSSLAGSCDDNSPWNPFGSGFLLTDWTVPLFVVKDSAVIQEIHECFVKFNLPLEGQTERSLCSLQMTGHMYAAVDTPTCLRRNALVNSFSPISYCDPMGDQNLVLYLFSPKKLETAANGSVVLVTARMDSAAMFDGLAPGAVTTVSGVVTLLTTAHLLTKLLPQHKDTYTKNVVLALLSGEAQDYIGSSRVVYDMQQAKFPSPSHPLHLGSLHQVIDIHQLSAAKQIHIHCYQSQAAQNTVEALVNSGKLFGVSVEGSCSSAKLPPSSLHTFLKVNQSIPGLVLTDHATQYTNRYYNGLMDDSVNVGYQYANGSAIPVAGIQTSLAAVSHTLALTLAQLVDPNIVSTNITVAATASLVDELLHCYLESRQCDMFRNVSGDQVMGQGPLPLYVGVSRSPNLATTYTFLTMAHLTGTPVNVTKEHCVTAPEEEYYHFKSWVGSMEPGLGVCMETEIFLTPAVSPAFLIENYNWTSGEFSSWTESVWPELSLRMFLRPAFNQEFHTLIIGLVVLLVSFVSVYWFNRNVDQLFDPLNCEHC